MLSVPCRPITAGVMSPQAGHSAGRSFCPEPPGSGADNPAPREPPRPCPPVSPGGVLTGEIVAYVTGPGTVVKMAVAVNAT